MSLERLTDEKRVGFTPKNFPPGTSFINKERICPVYDLIADCADLAGIDIKIIRNSPKFCGLIENLNRWSSEADDCETDTPESKPFTTCSEVSQELGRQLSFVKRTITLTETGNDNSNEGLIVRRAKEERELEIIRAIILRWKKIIIKNSDGRIKRIEDISDQVAIYYAETFFIKLKTDASGNELIQQGDSCPQKP